MLQRLRRGFSDVRLCAFPPTACEWLCFVASTDPELEALRFEFTQQSRSGGRGFLPCIVAHSLLRSATIVGDALN